MATALQCSNAACGKGETVPEGVLAPTSCLACGAPLEPATCEAGITTQPTALLVQPPPAPAAVPTASFTEELSAPTDGEPAWLADEWPSRKKRPQRIPATTRYPTFFLFGYEVTLGGLIRVVLPMALLAGAAAFAFWAAARLVTDTSGSAPVLKAPGGPDGQPPGRGP